MARYVFTEAEGEKWSWPGISGVSLSTSADFDVLSVSMVEVLGRHQSVSSGSNNRAFSVIAGGGWFEVAGERFEVVSHDAVIVPKNTVYDFGSSSGMKLVIVDTPAYVEQPGGENL